MKNKKILLLFCGGTISMHKNTKTKALEIANSPEQLFALEPRISEICDLSTVFIDNVDSTNFNCSHWEKIVETISDNYRKYDGFVVTMGTNTMGYCSAAISFALSNIGKPVAVTGAQIPAESLSTDSRNNLVNALRLVTMDLSGVFVVFGSRIIRGCRAKKVSESELDAFKTFNQKDFGEIGVGVLLNFKQPRHSDDLVVKNGFDDRLVCLTLIPGLRSNVIVNLIDNDTKGIILRAYGSGDIPSNFIPALEYAKSKGVPIVVTTQCPGGATVMGLNDVGLKALNTGVTQAFDMCMEAMSTKLMWLLAQNYSYEKIKELMEKNLIGEVDASRSAAIMELN